MNKYSPKGGQANYGLPFFTEGKPIWACE